MYYIIMLNSLNLHNVIRQFYVSKEKEDKKGEGIPIFAVKQLEEETLKPGHQSAAENGNKNA